MKKINYKIIILAILIIIVISGDLLLVLHFKSNKKESEFEKKSHYLCLKEENIESIEEEVNIDGEVLKNVPIFKYHISSKIEINYDEENDNYNVIENEKKSFKNRSYYEAHKKLYDSNKTIYTILDDENMELLFPIQYDKKSDEINDFINILQENNWICQ